MADGHPAVICQFRHELEEQGVNGGSIHTTIGILVEARGRGNAQGGRSFTMHGREEVGFIRQDCIETIGGLTGEGAGSVHDVLFQ